jgi:hypothetical protein
MSHAARPESGRSDVERWKRLGETLSPEPPKREIPATPAETPPREDAGDNRQCLMLDFRYRSGDSIALSYAYLISAAFDRSKGIALDFGGYEATVAGRNLVSLHREILEHRAAAIQEAGEMAAAGGSDAATVITRIVVKEKQ